MDPAPRSRRRACPMPTHRPPTSSLNTTHSAFLPQSTEEGWMATTCPVEMTL